MINIENKENIIYLFGRKEKELYTKIITDFKPYFYIEDKNGEHNSIEGKKLKKITLQKPSQVKLLRQRYKETWEADILYTNRYLIDEVKEIPKEEIRICYLDIEIQRTEKGYETPQEANNPILSICCYDSFDKTYEQFYQKFGKEKEMLHEFINYIEDKNPDIIVAWNGDGFDFPFLINRINKLGMDANLLSRNGTSFTTKYGAKIFGRALFDLMGAYKKHFAQGGRESWSLEYISRYEFGEGKEQYKGELDDLWQTDKEKFLKYNKRDVELLVMLDEKLGIINFFDEIRRMAFCKFEDVFMNSKTADCLCLKWAKEHNVVLPSVREQKAIKFEGGYVKESEAKLHERICVMDMKSLYPSIILGFNVSPECLI